MLVVHSNRSGWRMIKRAVRHRNLVAYAPRLGEPSRCFRFAFLVSEAARLRHGRDTEVSRPGLQLGRAGNANNPGFTEPALVLGRGQARAPNPLPTHQDTGTVSPAPLAGLISFATAPFRFVAIPQAAFPLHCIPTVTNCRDRHGQRCARRFRNPEAAMLRISAKTRIMAARLRPARTTAIRREASPIAEDISISPRGFARAGGCRHACQ